MANEGNLWTFSIQHAQSMKSKSLHTGKYKQTNVQKTNSQRYCSIKPVIIIYYIPRFTHCAFVKRISLNR